MRDEDIKNLIENIKVAKAEDSNIEIKSAKGGPPKIYDTLSSFSNQNMGGIILFGINEDKNFLVEGVYDVKNLIEDIISQCDEMEPTITPIISKYVYNGNSVVVAEIPGIDFMKRPVFRKAQGMVGGSYVRVGSYDRHMSQIEIYNYYAYKNRIKDDLRKVDKINEKLIDKELLNKYLIEIKKDKINLSNNVSDEEILEITGIKKDGSWTIAGLLIFSKYPQEIFPQFCITAVKIYKDIAKNNIDNNERFEDNIKITGNIEEMLNTAIDFIKRNIKTKTIIDNNGKRVDELEYPIIAIREAILNALVHRDYSIHSEGIPISIVVYNNEIEIINPGSIYGNVDINLLGKTQINARNEFLANALEVLRITENRYSGVPTMYNECERLNLYPPRFESSGGEFTVKFRNEKKELSDTMKKLIEYRVKHNEEFEIINFCEVPRTRQEIIDLIGKNKYHTINVVVKKLLDRGELMLTIPEKPKSPFQRYVVNRNYYRDTIKEVE